MLGLMPMEWSTKSILPSSCSIACVKTCSSSSTEVASAGMTILPVSSASLSSVPKRSAAAVFERASVAPSSWQRSATFQAMDFSLSAPNTIPLFPLSNPYDMIIYGL